MSQEVIDKLTSRKLWAFAIGVGAAFCYAFHLIDAQGLGAIVAAAGTYQIGEGLADLGSARAKVEQETVLAEAVAPKRVRRSA